jgi:hypothetical protein
VAVIGCASVTETETGIASACASFAADLQIVAGHSYGAAGFGIDYVSGRQIWNVNVNVSARGIEIEIGNNGGGGAREAGVRVHRVHRRLLHHHGSFSGEGTVSVRLDDDAELKGNVMRGSHGSGIGGDRRSEVVEVVSGSGGLEGSGRNVGRNRGFGIESENEAGVAILFRVVGDPMKSSSNARHVRGQEEEAYPTTITPTSIASPPTTIIVIATPPTATATATSTPSSHVTITTTAPPTSLAIIHPRSSISFIHYTTVTLLRLKHLLLFLLNKTMWYPSNRFLRFKKKFPERGHELCCGRCEETREVYLHFLRIRRLRQARHRCTSEWIMGASQYKS